MWNYYTHKIFSKTLHFEQKQLGLNTFSSRISDIPSSRRDVRFVLSIDKNDLIANDFHRYRYYLYWLLLDVIRLQPKLHRLTLFWKGGRSSSWSWAPTNLANYYQPSEEDLKERIRFFLSDNCWIVRLSNIATQLSLNLMFAWIQRERKSF